MAADFGAPAKVVVPGSFEMENHYYTRVLNAQLHPIVSFLFSLSQERLINRYLHLHPRVDGSTLREILSYKPAHIPWAGADLFHVTTAEGIRQMVIIETNSCPSGQKSIPPTHEHHEHGGYEILIERTFKPLLQKRGLPSGRLAVMYDKNPMENSGYAATIADVMKEDVFLVPFYDGDPDPSVRFDNGVMEVRDEQKEWHPIRGAFRYVTQRPWNRIPILTKTLILNPLLACLAGGRNKMVASKAYDLYNAELAYSGLSVITPETIRDVSKNEIPLWIKKFGGHAVVKVPYSNAGQGVYTIINQAELDDFMAKEHPYDQFIVQSLIGNFQWSSLTSGGRFYHVGTMPNKKQKIYVADLRFMVGAGEEGFYPLAIYSRRAKTPLAEKLDGTSPSWDMLGTNLSIKKEDGTWDTDTSRLLLMDRKDYNTLGIGLDDLIEAYIQTVLSVIAIDKMAKNLLNTKGRFRRKLFHSLNHDEMLMKEILI